MNKIIPYIAILLLTVSSSVCAQESKYKALYLFNFTKYIDWSEESITIGVVGNSPVLLELKSVIKQNPKVKLLKISGSESIDQCDMVFLPEAQSRNFDLIQSKIESSTLLITEDESLIDRGAAMAFFLENDKLKFVVNRGALDATGMKMSATLLSKAKLVN